MPDREKVIDEWETILNRDPLDAPWDLIDDTLALLEEQENAYEKGFNDAMQGKQELMYEGIDGKWYKKAW